MAEYQVVDKTVHDAELKSIGDSIRAKGGTTAPFNSAAEMKAAVDAIKTGGNIQPEKNVSITTNGDTLIMPDTGYDGVAKVIASVNVPTGGTSHEEDKILNKTIIEYKNTTVEEVGQYAFYGCNALKSVEFTRAKTFINWPFDKCQSLETMITPANETPFQLFVPFRSVKILDSGNETITRFNIGYKIFKDSSSVKTIILRYNTVAINPDLNNFVGSNVANGTAYIYVPKSLVDQYKAATNWVTYASQIRAIEDYPDITGG